MRVLKQGISSFICLVLTIIDLKVITREFLSPVNLSETQNFHVYELLEVVIVGKYDDFILKALYVVPLSLESLNNN